MDGKTLYSHWGEVRDHTHCHLQPRDKALRHRRLGLECDELTQFHRPPAIPKQTSSRKNISHTHRLSVAMYRPVSCWAKSLLHSLQNASWTEIIITVCAPRGQHKWDLSESIKSRPMLSHCTGTTDMTSKAQSQKNNYNKTSQSHIRLYLRRAHFWNHKVETGTKYTVPHAKVVVDETLRHADWSVRKYMELRRCSTVPGKVLKLRAYFWNHSKSKQVQTEVLSHNNWFGSQTKLWPCHVIKARHLHGHLPNENIK